MMLSDIQQQLMWFADNRDWRKFHTPRNLAAAISVEAGELQQLFLWDNQFNNPCSDEEVALELADIMIYCLNCFNAIGINADQAIQEKIRLNADRFAPAPLDTHRTIR
jgi:NTP pyrophosphatase (non-canonical NTP hydrolase)